MKDILNSLYLDALGPREFNATIANFTVNYAQQDILSLLPKEKGKSELMIDIVKTENGYIAQGRLEGYNSAIKACREALSER